MAKLETLAEIHGTAKRIAELKAELEMKMAYLTQLYGDAGTVAPKDNEELEITVTPVVKSEIILGIVGASGGGIAEGVKP